MTFREIDVVEVREVLRRSLVGDGLRTAAERAVDRKTARRYVVAAQAAGLVRDGGVAQLADELIGVAIGAVRSTGHGAAWDLLLALLALPLGYADIVILAAGQSRLNDS